jgi:hypothetical protein
MYSSLPTKKNRFTKTAALLMSLTLGAGLMFAVPPAASAGQQTAAAPQQTPGGDGGTGRNARQKTVGEIVRSISRAAGVDVVADSSVASRLAPAPTEPTTPQNYEQQVADLVKSLGSGATWAKLYLPTPAAGRGYNGDDVAAFALAQAKLFGRVGDTPAGQVEILGQTLPAEQAAPHIAGLNLKPVYLVTNPSAARQSGEDPNALWARMTPDERTQYAQSQAARLAQSDDATRQAFMQSHMQVMSQLMRQLTPEQRQAMLGGAGGNVRVFVSPGPNGTGQAIQVQRIEEIKQP